MKCRFCLLCCLLFCLTRQIAAQTPCYTTIKARGLQYMQQRNYVLAIDQFWTAQTTCDDKPEKNDLFDLIKKAQQAQIAILETNIKGKQIALLAADSAREVATQARQLESEARTQAETNAKIAREQGRVAESVRLSLLADIARERGQVSEAVYLSRLSLYLSNNAPALLRAYGASVRDSFTRKLFSTPAPVDWIGDMIVSGKVLAKNADQELYLVDPNTGNNTLLSGKKNEMLHIKTSASGKYFLTWSGNEPVQVWDAAGARLAQLQGHTEAIRDASFSRNDSLIVTGSRDNTVRVWTLDGRLQLEHSRHKGNVYAAFFSADSKTVFSRSSDGTACAWNLPENRVVPLGDAQVYQYDLAMSDVQDHLVATASADGFVRVWGQNGDLKSEKHLNEGAVLEAGFCPGTAAIMARTASGRIVIWNWEKSVFKTLLTSEALHGAVWSPEGNSLLSWSNTADLSLWTVEGELARRFPGITGGVASAAYSADGLYILVTGQNGSVRLLDTEGNIQMEWPADKDRKVCLLSDGHHILMSAGRQLSICPLPVWTLHQSGNLPDKNDPLISSLVKQYNIQFFEETR